MSERRRQKKEKKFKGMRRAKCLGSKIESAYPKPRAFPGRAIGVHLAIVAVLDIRLLTAVGLPGLAQYCAVEGQSESPLQFVQTYADLVKLITWNLPPSLTALAVPEFTQYGFFWGRRSPVHTPRPGRPIAADLELDPPGFKQDCSRGRGQSRRPLHWPVKHPYCRAGSVRRWPTDEVVRAGFLPRVALVANIRWGATEVYEGLVRCAYTASPRAGGLRRPRAERNESLPQIASPYAPGVMTRRVRRATSRGVKIIAGDGRGRISKTSGSKDWMIVLSNRPWLLIRRSCEVRTWMRIRTFVRPSGIKRISKIPRIRRTEDSRDAKTIDHQWQQGNHNWIRAPTNGWATAYRAPKTAFHLSI
ncbi:hypothetical protein B0H13DRAFT_1885558 [Mycena leptocephala]|nr:hypothetical protein B0H13DRAFT_1885558 [Mycena leptocephala]